MFERLKKELGFAEAAARVKFRNGKVVYGVIANYFSGKSVGKTVWFIPNRNHHDLFPEQAVLLNEDAVADIDLHLK